jgi:hypothetical protein
MLARPIRGIRDGVDEEQEGGACPICAHQAELLTCWECCDSAWVIRCGHLPGPRPITRGRCDGSFPDRLFCDECGEV